MTAIVVEFVGLSGVGKSTLSRRVAQIMRQRGWPCDEYGQLALRLPRRLLWTFHEVCGNPRYVWSSARAILASQQQSPTTTFRIMMNWLSRSRLSRQCSRREGVQLLDQSILQLLWSIGFQARNHKWSQQLLSLAPAMPLPDLTVVVNGSPMTICRRLVGRPDGGSRLQRLLVADQTSLRTAENIMDATKDLINRLSDRCPNMQILVIDNDRDTELNCNAERIVEWIRQHAQNN